MKCLYCGCETKNIIEDFEHRDAHSLYMHAYYWDICDNHNIDVSFKRDEGYNYYYMSVLKDNYLTLTLYYNDDGTFEGSHERYPLIKKMIPTPDNWDKFKSLLMFS
jgi:hypothetical protein